MKFTTKAWLKVSQNFSQTWPQSAPMEHIVVWEPQESSEVGVDTINLIVEVCGYTAVPDVSMFCTFFFG